MPNNIMMNLTGGRHFLEMIKVIMFAHYISAERRYYLCLYKFHALSVCYGADTSVKIEMPGSDIIQTPHKLRESDRSEAL